MELSRFCSEKHHDIHQTGMEQLQQSSHPLLPFADVHVMQW